MRRKIYYVLLLMVGLVFTQDPPEDFEFESTTQQGFYFFSDINILGEPLDENDWIGAFHYYDETLGGQCDQSEMDFDETAGGMCFSLSPGQYQCSPQFPECTEDDCNEGLDVDGDGILSECACLDINQDGFIASQNIEISIGARRYGDCLSYNRVPCDVPVMGYDGYTATAGYCEVGDIPKFKLYRPGSGELINMSGEFSIWTNNLIWYAGTLEGGNTIPNTFRIGNPYPNPFNPVTTITYDVPLDCELELSIFDLQGRLVEKLIAGEVKAGYYEIQWNARMQASGIYFMRMRTPNTTMIRKLVLMK